MKNNTTKNLVLAALFAALIFVTTSFLRVPFIFLPNSGYIHFGDAFIFLSACFLPPGFAACAASIGAAFADYSIGGNYWIPFTIIIKALMAIVVFNKSDKIINARNFIFVFIASIINIVGYYFAEVAIDLYFLKMPLAVSFAAPLPYIPLGLIQFAGSIVCFIIIGFALDKTKIKNSLR